MDTIQCLQIAKKLNINNFDDFMNHYQLTHGELLGIIDYALRSNLSLLQEASLRKVLKQKQSLFRLTDTKVGIISDIHIGSHCTNWNYVDQAYDFFSENDINVVLNLGDLFHGFSYRGKNDLNRAIFECYSQLVDFESRYPNGFTTFLVHGNHEKRFEEVGMDLWEHIPTRRDDVFSIGEGRCCITFGDTLISLNHPTLTKDFISPDYGSSLSLYGHGHAFYKNKEHISLTSCSDLILKKNSYGLAVPGFSTLEDQGRELVFTGYSLEEGSPRKVLEYTLPKKRKG